MSHAVADQGQLSFDDDHAERMRIVRVNLVELAKELLLDDAMRARVGEESHGVTFGDVRLRAETRGLLTGEEEGRTLSFGAAVMREAGGKAAGHRPSRHRNSHGRLVAVFRLAPPEPREAAPRARRAPLKLPKGWMYVPATLDYFHAASGCSVPAARIEASANPAQALGDALSVFARQAAE